MDDAVKKARKQYELARRNRKVVSAPVCSRCGMTEEEHRSFGNASLQLHHVIALKDGGHPTDPENLITLCKFCHDWWHKYCEPFDRDWDEFMTSEPVHQTFWEEYKCGKN